MCHEVTDYKILVAAPVSPSSLCDIEYQVTLTITKQVMHILLLSLPLAILLKCVVASEGVAKDVIQALEEDGFEDINENWEQWKDRNDLFDHVATKKKPKFIARFINQVGELKQPTLAALFIKRPDIVEKVLKKINYVNNDLIYLTNHRPELAKSHEGFFKAVDKISGPKNQKAAIRWGVINLFGAEKHDSVIPLITALGGDHSMAEIRRMLRFNKHFIEEQREASKILLDRIL